MNHAEKINSVPPPPLRRCRAALLGALLLLPLRLAWSAETNAPTAPFLLHVGMAKICFHNVNPNDATAAYRVLLERTAREFGVVVKADTKVFDDTPAFETALRHQVMHLAIMDAWQFLVMDIHQEMKPFCTVLENGQVGRKYLVLTRRDSGLDSLAALRGKSILQLDVASIDVVKLWLDTLLLADKLGTRETFFGGMALVTNEGIEPAGRPAAPGHGRFRQLRQSRDLSARRRLEIGRGKGRCHPGGERNAPEPGRSADLRPLQD